MKKLLLAVLLACCSATAQAGFKWKYGPMWNPHGWMGTGVTMNTGHYKLLDIPSVVPFANYRSYRANLRVYDINGLYNMYLYCDPGNVYRDTTAITDQWGAVHGFSTPQAVLQTGSFTGASSCRLYLHVLSGSVKLRDLVVTEED